MERQKSKSRKTSPRNPPPDAKPHETGAVLENRSQDNNLSEITTVGTQENLKRTTVSNWKKHLRKWPTVLTVAISLSALVTSVCSHSAMLRFNVEQNAKWDALNQPRINPTSISLVAFEELDTGVAKTRDWGYPAIYIPAFKDDVYTGRSRVYTELVFWDTNTKKIVSLGPIILTVQDAGKEAKRLNINLGSSIILQKHYQFVVTFRNSGQLSANNVKAAIDVSTKEGGLPRRLTEIQAIRDLAGGEEFKIYTDLCVDLNQAFTDIHHFRIAIDC